MDRCSLAPTTARSGLARRLLAALALATLATDASAQGPALVLGLSLALMGAIGGAVAGAIAASRGSAGPRGWVAFLVYLGVLCALASTRTGSLEIVPLTLVLGAFAGVLPFGVAFLAVRALLARLCGWLRARSARRP